MSDRSRGYRQTFDRLLMLPLALYVGVIGALVLSVLFSVTPSAVRQAFTESDVLFAVWLSIATTLVGTGLSMLVAVPAGYVLSRRDIRGLRSHSWRDIRSPVSSRLVSFVRKSITWRIRSRFFWNSR